MSAPIHIQRSMSLFVDVRRYGAKGDGVTDDYAAIVRAIAALPAFAVLFFPAGVYRISQTITVTRSDITILGAGRYATYFLPDQTQAGGSHFENVFFFQGTSDAARLSNIEVRDIGIDGTNRPVDPTLGYARLRFQFCNNLAAGNVYLSNTHDGIVLRGVIGFEVEKIHSVENEECMVTMLQGCKRGRVTDLLGYNVDECVDLFDGEDIVISNIRATGNTAAGQEAVDLSSSRRITVSDVNVTGFGKAVFVKSETNIPWADIHLEDIHAKDFTVAGVDVQASGTTGDRLTIRDSSFVSTQAGALGIFSSYAGSDLTIEGNEIDVPGNAIEAKVTADILIRENNRIRSTGGHGIFVWSTTPQRPKIIGNKRVSSAGGTLFYGISVEACQHPEVIDNEVTSSAGDGMRVNNCLYPRIKDNRVLTAALNGITLRYNATTAIDNTNKVMGAVIDGNEVRNWNSGTGSRYAILFQVATVGTGETWKAASVSNNRCFIEGGFTPGGITQGIGFDKGLLTAFDAVKCDNNLVSRATTAYTTAALSGAACTIVNNTTA